VVHSSYTMKANEVVVYWFLKLCDESVRTSDLRLRTSYEIGIIVIGEYIGIWKELVVSYFKSLSTLGL